MVRFVKNGRRRKKIKIKYLATTTMTWNQTQMWYVSPQPSVTVACVPRNRSIENEIHKKFGRNKKSLNSDVNERIFRVNEIIVIVCIVLAGCLLSMPPSCLPKMRFLIVQCSKHQNPNLIDYVSSQIWISSFIVHPTKMHRSSCIQNVEL